MASGSPRPFSSRLQQPTPWNATGPDVAELLHAATIAIIGRVPAERLRHAVPAFPTRSEVWLRLLDKYARVKEKESQAALAAA